jgi:hypothetical protein
LYSHFELWPPLFTVTVTAGTPILETVNEWLQVARPPMATFMPDRLADAAQHARNKQVYTFSPLLVLHRS